MEDAPTHYVAEYLYDYLYDSGEGTESPRRSRKETGQPFIGPSRVRSDAQNLIPASDARGNKAP